MKFTVSGSRIVCSRLDTTVPGNDTYRQVVQFDANVDKVPPHVEARLTSGEVKELEQILEDRRRIQQNSPEKNMLEVLPGLVRDATEILNSIEQLDQAMYEQLQVAIANMATALENVRPIHHDGSTTVDRLSESEAQKARLDNIRQEML